MACKGQGFKSPQLHSRSAALSAVGRPPIPALAQQMRSNRLCAADAVVQGGGDAGDHRGSRLSVDPRILRTALRNARAHAGAFG
jgi:hypothetical protein